MPVYEYKCVDRGHRFEVLRKLQERDEPIECPDCRSGNTRREVSPFGTGISSGCYGSSGSCGCPGGSKFG
ncbi:FmdB family zinc ribbon protein [Thermosediminibacter oceani]|uniref:Regulatory protein, FmdB family n=1 Tax=Thermosediminibacter oceani (strain ATCC BAA-1034 / DSM 16646 / JW/IW-1228P) TaxID=555079 RepID=D9S2F5_THEOJ|nr:zinc ribbon domain-containing protein [Thermosediminibacter oceani]ADL07582.1 regulatory protein, FmdB family [Thermosediminibacter oceani DSM 16646]